jgi:hypothetical protein
MLGFKTAKQEMGYQHVIAQKASNVAVHQGVQQITMRDGSDQVLIQNKLVQMEPLHILVGRQQLLQPIQITQNVKQWAAILDVPGHLFNVIVMI